jgi:hypothetical protein
VAADKKCFFFTISHVQGHNIDLYTCASVRIVHWKMREVQKGGTMSKLAAKLVHLCLIGAISK